MSDFFNPNRLESMKIRKRSKRVRISSKSNVRHVSHVSRLVDLTIAVKSDRVRAEGFEYKQR